MDETQSFQTFFTFSAKEHPGLPFWVQVEWGKPVLQEPSFIIQKLLRATRVELAALIGAHVGLKPGKDLTHPVIQYFSSSPDCLLILDNLETLWDPVESRGKIEEFLSLLTSVDHLALVPLEQDAAWQTFIDIADNTHDPKEVDKVLSLTDNMPLTISLMAHLVDSKGCSHILSCWEEEKTSLISDGYDRTSNLDLSISLSLSGPRLNPHSKDLLSLLSMLPDGLSNVELVQSKLPIDNILGCKASLICTTLAYSDEHKRVKALVPIREYMQRIQPPVDHLIQPLCKHFQELLELYIKYQGNESDSSTIARISSNYSNIQNVLQNGLQQGHPDLANSIYCACYLNKFSQLMGKGPISLLLQIHNVFPHPRDHHLEVYFIIEYLNSCIFYSISNPETLVSELLEHFKEFDDPDLKCRFYNSLATYYQKKGDMSSAMKYCAATISLALSTGNTKQHSQALQNLARVEWTLGNYSAAQVHAVESQRLALISANLCLEVQALNMEATCYYTLGNYMKAMSLCIRVRDLLLGHFGMSHRTLDYDLMDTQAEIHRLKSEYAEARSIQIRIVEETSIRIPTPMDDVQRNCDIAGRMSSTIALWDSAVVVKDKTTRGARLFLRGASKRLFKTSQIQTYCLERLGDASCWGGSEEMFSWITVFLVHSVSRKEKLGIYKAFQFLGDIFLSQNDEHTAISLFNVALEGFTQMDVHRSRAECMLQFGDISMGHGDLLKAVEFWEAARPLPKQVQYINERLAGISNDVLEQHRNLAHMAELNAPSGTVEDDQSEIEELDEVDMGDGERA
ncbi:hypothetical protein B0H13DRAFT_1927328 [Mycena leptocephala]|nr:hypothetical protein B0H13DRAFT_1927328 [Mycena leptocephala]